MTSAGAVWRWVGVFAAAGALASLPAVAVAYQPPGVTERVSVATDGSGQKSEALGTDISDDGRLVAFVSNSDNLGPNTLGNNKVFVRDRARKTTELADPTVSPGAVTPYFSMSADGRYVAYEFYSDTCAIALFSLPTCGEIYVRDRQRGVTELVSVSADGVTPANDQSYMPNISGDGRYVVFASLATNLTSGVPAPPLVGSLQLFVRDRVAGKTELVTVNTLGSPSAGGLFSSWSISDDGRYVQFSSLADDLVASDPTPCPPADPPVVGGFDPTLCLDTFVRDRVAGTTEVVSLGSDGAAIRGTASAVAMSADGRFVAFAGQGRGVPTRGADGWDVYVRDREAGTTEVVSLFSDGTGFRKSGGGGGPVFGLGLTISADGRYVVFAVHRRPRAGEDPSRPGRDWVDEIVLHDRLTGVTERLDVASDGTLPDGQFMTSPYGYQITPDGRYVTLMSAATNLAPGDANDHSAQTDVFLRDRGPLAGIGGITASEQGGGFDASGWARFAAAEVTSAADTQGDGVDAAGAELTRARIVNRPEQEDVLIDLDLKSLPMGSADGALLADADTVYRVAFTLDGKPYEVRLARSSQASDPPGGPYAALYECAPACTRKAVLGGAVGTTGYRARVAVPLGALGVDGPADLTRIVAAASRGTDIAGTLQDLDSVALPDAHLALPEVKLGIGASTSTESDALFSTDAQLEQGRFSATLNPTEAGPQRLWSRACLAVICGFGAVEITVVPAAPANQSAPVLQGVSAVGKQLTCPTGAWSGRPAPTYSRQWLRDGEPISGAVSDSYALIDADAATAIACRVTATNAGGSAAATSAPVSVPAVAPTSGSAVVEGAATVGNALSCAPSGFGGAPAPTYAYRWLRDGEAIAGATSGTYTVMQDDAGHALTCRVTATNAGGSAQATSAGREVPASPDPTPAPTPSPDPNPTTSPGPRPSDEGQQAPPNDRAPVAKGPVGGLGPLQLEVRAARGRQLRGRRALKLRLVSREPLSHLTASLTRARREYGRERLKSFTGSRRITIKLTRPLRRGTYKVVITTVRGDGSRASVAVPIRVR